MIESLAKFLIGIHSELIRTNPNHSKIFARANQDQSKPIQKKFPISIVENSLKPETSEEFEIIRTQIDSDSFGLIIRFRSIRVQIDSN